MILRRFVVVSALCVLAPALAAAQGLGDTAARERKRRASEAAKKVEPPKVLTNEDLAAGRPPGQATTAGESVAPAPEPQPSSEGGLPPLEDPQAAVRPYIDNLRQAQDRVAAAEARIRDLSSKLNPMSTSFIYGASGSNSANEEAAVRQQLQEAETELREARTGLAAANQALDAARRGRSTPLPSTE